MKHNQMRQVVFPSFWRPLSGGTSFVSQDIWRRPMGGLHLQRHPLLHRRTVSAGGDRRHERHSEGPAPAHGGGKRRPPASSCGWAASAAAPLWPSPPTSSRRGLVAGTDAGKAGFITALYVVLVPLFGLFFRRKVSGPV